MVGEKQLIPESGTTERREWMRKIARKGGSVSAAERRARAKFRKLVNSMLDIPVNTDGKLGEILSEIGIEPGDVVSARQGIIGVFIAKAISGDLKAARFILDLSGATDIAAEKQARIKVLEATAEAGGLGLADAVKASEPPTEKEIEIEAARMGVYSEAVE